MTAESMRWLLRLMRLQNGKQQSFLIHFARHMYTITEGVPRDCWKEIVVWAGMPELLVNMTLEVEVDSILSKPMNKIFYEKTDGRPCGFVVHKLPKTVHEQWRPLIERIAADPLNELKSTAAAIAQIPDAALRDVKTKQVGSYTHHRP